MQSHDVPLKFPYHLVMGLPDLIAINKQGPTVKYLHEEGNWISI